MGNTWITDMSHSDYSDEQEHEVPRQAKRLAEYFASIIEGTLRRPPMFATNVGIQCRRRPGRRPCSGVIQSELHPRGNDLRWWCPECGDSGRIYNWIGTRWEPKTSRQDPIPFRRLFDATHREDGQPATDRRDGASAGEAPDMPPEVLTGRIEWDEEQHNLDRSIPKIVTADREYTWEELGELILTYEGRHIRVEFS